MQLCHGYDAENFPFVIARDFSRKKLFLVNVNSQKHVPLINLKDCVDEYTIWDIQQSSKFAAP
jgi:hypothetical protein